ncbi:hypothetical protein PMAYCL1PPCAC_17406 [Pristionchus mayeri]|uniref:N-acetyltransferase domain-containing protein n=1 Tax=Pristionchus mayeri TaxID=1317129 RepID=A0AAN5CMK1_9BILA|nr:hypothetical protein PMAYCL1PPCAC_17406 [Pristionchus mayeri]
MHLPPHTLVDEGTDLLWAQFAIAVRGLNWTSDDNQTNEYVFGIPSVDLFSILILSDGSFLGCVVWMEYDEIAFIGMYIVVPEYRGCGIGSRMWERTLGRIDKGKILALRGAPAMAPKYAARDTPFELSRIRTNILSCEEMRKTCDSLNPSTSSVLLKSSLSPAQIEELLQFDKEMTGRDRHDLLVPFLAPSSSFECAVLLNAKGEISAWAGITSTGFEEYHQFKLGPVYASSLSQFAALTKSLISFCEKASSESKIVVHIITGTVGERELEPLLANPQNVEWPTLFSKKIDWRARKEACYVPHSCGVRFDA